MLIYIFCHHYNIKLVFSEEKNRVECSLLSILNTIEAKTIKVDRHHSLQTQENISTFSLIPKGGVITQLLEMIVLSCILLVIREIVIDKSIKTTPIRRGSTWESI